MMQVLFQRQTVASAYAQLASGIEGERVAIGNFINDFFCYAVDQRQELLDEPLQVPENATPEQLGWAAFCAGAAEYLAERYDLACPAWAQDPVYTLAEPWYHPACRMFSGLHESALETTPAPFKKRNVWCGDTMFSNPYESSREPGNRHEWEQRRQRLLAGMTAAERDGYLAQMAGRPRVTIVA